MSRSALADAESVATTGFAGAPRAAESPDISVVPGAVDAHGGTLRLRLIYDLIYLSCDNSLWIHCGFIVACFHGGEGNATRSDKWTKGRFVASEHFTS